MGPADETVFTNDIDLLTTDHPMVHGPDRQPGTADDLTQRNIQWESGCCAALGALPPLPSGATTIISAFAGEPILAEYSFGSGIVIVTTMPLEFGFFGDTPGGGGFGSPRRILLNELFYAIEVARNPIDLTRNLQQTVLGLGLSNGLENSLVTKLDSALAKLEDGDPDNDGAAINMLEAFINEVEAQRGKEISEEDADELIAAAEIIIAALGA